MRIRHATGPSVNSATVVTIRNALPHTEHFAGGRADMLNDQSLSIMYVNCSVQN
jgi:hypothetical protein